jgi:hypothetical protein
LASAAVFSGEVCVATSVVSARWHGALAIDARDSDLMLVMPHRHGGVASMLVALEDAGLGVSRIEPRIGEAGTYRLTVQGTAEVAVTILEGIGCTVTPSPYPPTLS